VGVAPTTRGFSESPENPRKTLVFPRISMILSLSTVFASRLERLPFFAGKRGTFERPRNTNPVDYRIRREVTSHDLGPSGAPVVVGI
jgi:hypothetical protein